MTVETFRLRWSNVHVILGRRPVLVDSGSPGDAKKIVRRLAGVGVDVKDLAAIVLTHGHADHAGSARDLQELSGAPVIAHGGDASMLRAGKNHPLKATNLMGRLLIPLVDFPFRPVEPDVVVESRLDLRGYGVDGEILPLQGGHTAGSVAILLADHTALVGDLLRGGLGGPFPGRRANIHYFSDDVATVRRELRGLVEEGVTTFHVGHGGPVPSDSVKKRLLSSRAV